MKTYMIYLERKDRCKTYRYFKFKCQVISFYKALEEAKIKIEKLKSQVEINYEIIKIEKI